MEKFTMKLISGFIKLTDGYSGSVVLLRVTHYGKDM